MRPDEKAFLGHVLSFSAVAGFLQFFVEVPLHEFGHYWAASFVGVPMYIDGERTIFATGEVVPAETRAIIFLAGGLFAGCMFLVLFLLVRVPYRDGFLPLIAAEFAYMPLDGTMEGSEFGLIALVVVWGLIFTVYLARFLGWTAPKARSVVRSNEATARVLARA